MSDYLPADVWGEILLKLPIKSLIRFTTVCKSWKSLITSPGFIYAHLSHSKNHSILHNYDEHNEHDHYLSVEPAETVVYGSIHIRPYSNGNTPFNKDYGILGSCHGIVCLTDSFLVRSLHHIVLWNPSVRNHVVLPQPPQAITNPKKTPIVLVGFGVVNHVYKVVRIVYSRKLNGYDFVVPPHVEIFSVGTERWRSIRELDIKLQVLRFKWRQVLLEGIVHWLGYESDNRSYRNSILAFDMGNEVFGEVMLPDALIGQSMLFLRLYKFGESLAVMDYGHLSDVCNVWAMKEYGVRASWTKLYSIDLAKLRINYFIVGFMNGKVVLSYHVPDQKWPDLVSYNVETKEANDLGIPGTRNSFFIDDYVESLLLLKGNNVPAVHEIGESVVVEFEGLDIAVGKT